MLKILSTFIIIISLLSSCVYFNTFYLARKNFDDAEQQRVVRQRRAAGPDVDLRTVDGDGLLEVVGESARRRQTQDQPAQHGGQSGAPPAARRVRASLLAGYPRRCT